MPGGVQRIVGDFIRHYNEVRLHSSIGYVKPKDKLEGRAQEIGKERDRKLEEARQQRALKRKQQHEQADRGLHSTP